MHRKFFVLTGIAVLLVACQFPLLSQQPTATPASLANALLTPNSNLAPSRTPFQPVVPTVQNTPTVTPTSIQPTGQPTLPTSKNQMNILLLGSDWRPNAGSRTDVVLLVSLNPDSGFVSVVSFPRDLWVNIPGIGQERINTAEEFGGFPLTQATFQNNFGLRVDRYIETNFAGFQAIVDTLGGVDIVASTSLYDKCDLPWRDSSGYCYVGSGQVHLDGATALWYVRSRYSTSDFDRTRRAQEVVLGMFQKLMSLNALTRAPELYSLFSSDIETDLSLSDLTSYLPLASTIMTDQSKIHRYAVGSSLATGYITSAGADVLLPNYAGIEALLQQALSGQ
jgi:polyisoprenyl-teichoic acid--peptidoglycan teichoic acid transferase